MEMLGLWGLAAGVAGIHNNSSCDVRDDVRLCNSALKQLVSATLGIGTHDKSYSSKDDGLNVCDPGFRCLVVS